jgi:carbon storage regulator
MLVLTRREDQSIVIDDNIRITVLSLAGNKVRLGITAPDTISVDRQEIYERRRQFLCDLQVGAML